MAEAEHTTIARPYARAVFSRALEVQDGLATWSTMLALLAETVSQPVIVRALDNPRLSSHEEAALVSRILGDTLTEEATNFLKVLGDNGRVSLLPEISETYEHLKAQYEKTSDVSVTSAFDVSEEDRQRLESALKERLQKNINLTTSVDQDLMGGVVIRTEDTVIDNSVRGKLTKLAQTLY